MVSQVDYSAPVPADSPSAAKAVLRRTTVSTSASELLEVSFRDSDGRVGSRDELTHWIHWYPAKMFHRIPASILDALYSEAPVVLLDPFCGSGTVLLEAARRGHQALGVDVNPLARLITRVKTTPLDKDHLEAHLEELMCQIRNSEAEQPMDPRLVFWFSPSARSALAAVIHAINGIAHPRCRDFFTVSFSSIVRRSSRADPSIAPPVRLKRRRIDQATSRYERAFRQSSSLRTAGVIRAFDSSARANIVRVARLTAASSLGRVEVLSPKRMAADTGLPSQSVDVVITSPPYCGAQKYVRSLSLEMLWLGYSSADLRSIEARTVGSEHVSRSQRAQPLLFDFPELQGVLERIHAVNATRAFMVLAYLRELRAFAKELQRVLRPGASAFVTFGTSRLASERVALDTLFRPLAIEAGMTVHTTLVDTIPSRGLLTRRHASAGVIPDERILWLRT